MRVEPVIIQRLAFIKYLFNLGFEQSRKPEPHMAASVLTFHDGVELFLQLCAESFNIDSRNLGFMDYWESMAPKIPAGGLTQKEPMRRLNRCRVALKHHGTLPSRFDIEYLRASTSNFFEENSRLVFGIEFVEISMISLIQCKKSSIASATAAS